MADCADCGVPDERNRRNHYCRGLCRTCYDRAYRRGELIDHERVYRPAAELLSEWDDLRREGFSVANAAPRIGVTRDALERAINRARQRELSAA